MHKAILGFTWISVLVVLATLSLLLTFGVPYWQNTQLAEEKRILFNDVSRVIAFARTEAFLREETLVLRPLDETSSQWQHGIRLETACNPSQVIYEWPWHFSKHVSLTWHGFLSRDKLIISSTPESLAMNGYFLLTSSIGASERWIVSRFGRVRVRI